MVKEFSSQLLENIAANAQIEQRLTLPYTPYGNSACEAAVKSAKAIIIKMLDGCAENWDLYLDGTAYSLNLHKSRLHDTKALKDKIKRIDKILVRAIKNQIVRTQKADNASFIKRHRILEKPFPIGASVIIKNIESINSKTDPKYEGIFYIHGYTKNGSYILKDKTNTFLSRDVPTSQIKLIDAIPNPEDNPADAEYEVQAIIKHRGEAPNYEYLVRWKGFDASWDTWEIASNFDSKEPIKLYWSRHGATSNDSSNKRKRAPCCIQISFIS
ncbi:hypothetical protein, partial, partial [Parasitella parasitica]